MIEATEVKKRKATRRPNGPKVRGGSLEARRAAAMILDVLGGQRTPTDAAGQLGVSLVRYYVLESRALEAMVAACEAKPKGRVVTPQKQIAALEAQIARLERQIARQQTLLRLAQRAVGIAAPPKPPVKGKRQRKPTVRALRAADLLRSEAPAVPAEGGTQG